MEERQKLAPADYIALVIIPVSIFAVYIPAIISGSTALALPLEHDIILQWIPFKELAATCLNQGLVPLWTTNLFAGMPFLAFSHTGVLYPFGWMLLHDYASSVNWFYPIHLIIAAYGMFFLLRGFRLSAFPSALASLCLVLTGKFFYFIHFLPSTCSNPWSPWFFYFILQIMRMGRLRHALGLSAVFAMQMLGGDVESTSYQIVFAAPFLAIIWWREGRGMKAGRLVPIMIALALGAALAAAQVGPLLEYSKDFIRAQGVTFDYFTSRMLPIKLIWGLIYPFHSFEEMGDVLSAKPYLYMGVIPVIFSLIALVRGSRPSSRLVFLLAMAALVYSFGSLPALDWIIYHIPFLNRYGAPEHAFYLFQIFIIITAAQGLDHVLRLRDKYNWSKRVAMFLFILISIIFIIDIYTKAFIYLDRNKPEEYRLSNEIRELVNKVEDKNSRFIAVSKMGIKDLELTYHMGMRMDTDFADGWITVPPLRYAKFMNRIDPRAAEFDEDGKLDKLGLNVNLRDGLFISEKSMPLLDLLSLGYILNRGLNLKFSSPYSLSSGDNSAERSIILGDGFPRLPPQESFRVFADQGDILSFSRPYSSVYNEKEDVVFQVGLRQDKILNILYQMNLTQLEIELGKEPDYIQIPLERWAGKEVEIQFSVHSRNESENKGIISEVFAFISNKDKPIQKISKAGHISLLKNIEALPRAFVAHEVEVIEDTDELLDNLAGMDRFSLRRKILLERHDAAERVLEKSVKERNINPEKYKAMVNRVRRGPGLDEYRVRSVIPGMLFTSDQYLPGWRAEVDGKEFPVLRADYCFRAVFVPEGDHLVRLFYDPISFHIGLWTSIATILSILLIPVMQFFLRFYSGPGPSIHKFDEELIYSGPGKKE